MEGSDPKFYAGPKTGIEAGTARIWSNTFGLHVHIFLG